MLGCPAVVTRKGAEKEASKRKAISDIGAFNLRVFGLGSFWKQPISTLCPSLLKGSYDGLCKSTSMLHKLGTAPVQQQSIHRATTEGHVHIHIISNNHP